jgi:hypothetical protein
MSISKKLAVALTALVLTLSACSSPIGQATTPLAPPVANASDRTVILPVTANGKKVLFDNSHGETAGAADWVIDGAFSDFANALAARGYRVGDLCLNRAFTLADLSGYDVFVLPEPNIPLKTSEQQALLDYAAAGGSILFIADHYNADRNLNRWDAGEIFNGYRRGAFGNPTKGMTAGEIASAAMQGVTSTDWLATNFGVRFRYNALGNVNATDIVASSQAFGITAGVSAFAMHAGATVAILNPTVAKGIVYLPATSAKWSNAVDQGVYNGGGRAEGPMVAVAKKGAGKAAFIGDSSPVEDATPKYKREDTGGTKTTYAGWSEVNDATLMVQLVDWLAVRESYTNLSQVAGLTLDTATSLLAMENPASSTEPQAEPWSTPAAGYLWYDQSTFKTGAYKYASTPATGLSEGFESGSKTAYASASVTLSSGSWTMADALIGKDSADHKIGAAAARVRNTGTLTMNFSVANGIGTVSVAHAVYGSDGSSAWSLWYSTNSGSTWTQAGSSVTTSSASLGTASFTVNKSGAVRLQIRKTSGGSNRINLDSISATTY